MTDTWTRWGGVIITALATLPLAALVTWALAVWRRGWRDPLLEVAMVVGTAPWIWMILTPNGSGSSINVVPLSDLADLRTAGFGVIAEQLVGNLLVFAALGCCLPIRWAWFARPARILMLGIACSVGVETAQYLLDIGRQSSIDDVLVNSTGALLAGLCSRRWWARDAVHRADREVLTPG